MIQACHNVQNITYQLQYCFGVSQGGKQLPTVFASSLLMFITIVIIANKQSSFILKGYENVIPVIRHPVSNKK